MLGTKFIQSMHGTRDPEIEGYYIAHVQRHSEFLDNDHSFSGPVYIRVDLFYCMLPLDQDRLDSGQKLS